MPWSLLRSPPSLLGATDPFIQAADRFFQYSAAQGKRQPGQAFRPCHQGALDPRYMICKASRGTGAPPRGRDPIAIALLCESSIDTAYQEAAGDAIFAVGAELPLGLVYMGDSSLIGRFLCPHAFDSDLSLQARRRSFCRA